MRNRDLELQTTSPFSNHGSVEQSTACFRHKMFYKNNDSLEGAQEFRRFFSLLRHGQVPSKHTIKTWIKNFEETGSALKKKPTAQPRSACGATLRIGST